MCAAAAQKGKTELLDRKGLENSINDRKGVKKEVPPIAKYIDPICFMTNPSYRVAVEQAIHNPYWQGIRFPFHGLVTWRELADCMKDDEDGSTNIYERVAEIVEIAGDKCPIIRFPDPSGEGKMVTLKNPLYKKNLEYSETQSIIMADSGMVIFDHIRDLIKKGFLEASPDTPVTEGLEATRLKFDQIYFFRKKRSKKGFIQGDVVFYADLSSKSYRMEYKNIRLRLEIDYNAKRNDLQMSNWIYSDCGVVPYREKRLNQSLQPVIKTAEDFEKAAEEFLHNHYPEALGDKPVAINPWIVADRMHASINKADLSELGNDTRAVYYPEGKKNQEIFDSTGKRGKTDLVGKTILYDRNIESNPIALSGSILHECLHIFKDDDFYYAQKNYGRQLAYFACRGGRHNSSDVMGRSENLVKRLLPRVQMPRRSFLKKAEELLTENLARWSDTWRAYDETIRQLSTIYNVSRESARIRMTELGFDNARGVSRYLDGRYIPSFSWTPGSIDADQTFTISFAESLEEYGKNPAFQAIVSSGAYVYVDGHYCLNDSRYVYRDRNGYRMTAEARRHMDKCCLVFDVKYKRNPTAYRPGVFFNSERKSQRSVALDSSAEELIKNFRTNLNESIDATQARFTAFGERLKDYREAQGYSQETLEELTGITVRTIRNYETNPDIKVNVSYVVGICKALDLSSIESIELLELGGYKLSKKRVDGIYTFVLENKTDLSLGQINWLLEQSGEKPLTPLILPIESSGKTAKGALVPA